MVVFTRVILKFLLGVLIPLSVKAQGLLPVTDGLYQIQGTNSERGDYSGQAWIHGSQVQRVIRWKSFRSQDKEVESIWTGILTANTMEFSLGLSSVLTSFEDFTPSVVDLQTPIKVSLPRSPSPASFSFQVSGEGHYAEVWQRLGDASNAPLWRDLRKSTEGVGDEGPLLIKLVRWLGIDTVIDWYRSDPQAQAYKDRPEFRDKKQYFIQDKTDADFYARNPHVLRVANKTLNPLSLAEALMRRNAYAPSLSEKADFLGHQTLTNNLNSAGLLELALVDVQGHKRGRVPDHDSALWTSMYAWSEIMRYQVTKDPQAVVNFRRMLDGILTLVEITGDSKEFARALLISPPEEVVGTGWSQGLGKYSHLKWRQRGNNDMIKGVFITLALAHQVVGSEEIELRSRIQKVSKALLGLTAVKDRGFNSGIAHGLIALWTQDEDELQTFSRKVLNLQTVLGDVTKVGVGFYTGGIADWSGIQLSMVSNLCQILISQELQKVFSYNNKGFLAAQTLKSAEARLWERQKVYKNAHRDFLTLITYAFSPKARNDKAFQVEAQEALWILKEVPAPRNIGRASVDLFKNSNWSPGAWPWLPWKALTGFRKLKAGISFDKFVQGAYSYPLFETTAWQSTYLWKESPFSVRFASNPQVQSFSADYLMLYWASRVSGLLPLGQ